MRVPSLRSWLRWEDVVLLTLTSAWSLFGSGMVIFHLFTMGVMVAVFSVGWSQGLTGALVRTAVVAAVIFGSPGFKGESHPSHIASIASMMLCAVLAGFFGDREKRDRDALKRSFLETLEVLTRALEARDPYTEGHSRRVSGIAFKIAQAMNLDRPTQIAIEQAGLLHDLGKIGVPDHILRKEGPLTTQEEQQMHQHPIVGGRILKGVQFLGEAAVLVQHHHERYDGSGYPDGLAGSAIPLGARILAVADVFDALTTDRPYRKASSPAEGLQELERGAGHLFDPAVVKALKVYEEANHEACFVVSQ